MRRPALLPPIIAAVALLASCAQPAFAHRHRPHPHHSHARHDTSNGWARPSEWCGWFLRRVEHVSTEAANSALWWASHFGRPADGPAVGRVVVWSHGNGHGHVGKIVGKTVDGWVVLSGNDGGRVRKRVRRVDNAVAFRDPS